VHALIIYESMYGNTRAVAEEVATGMRSAGASVTTVHASDAAVGQTAAADLVVVGGPTHAWSMPRPSTRRGAVDAKRKSPDTDRHLETGAEKSGLREWIEQLPAHDVVKPFAAFDTRRRAPLGLSGSAAKAVDRRLRRHGWRRARAPQGFYVTKTDQLEPDALARARSWGTELVGSVR
jgi:hypothetical protein